MRESYEINIRDTVCGKCEITKCSQLRVKEKKTNNGIVHHCGPPENQTSHPAIDKGRVKRFIGASYTRLMGKLLLGKARNQLRKQITLQNKHQNRKSIKGMRLVNFTKLHGGEVWKNILCGQTALHTLLYEQDNIRYSHHHGTELVCDFWFCCLSSTSFFPFFFPCNFTVFFRRLTLILCCLPQELFKLYFRVRAAE